MTRAATQPAQDREPDDRAVATIYAAMSRLEEKAGEVRARLDRHTDRLESRLATDLADIAAARFAVHEHLTALDEDLTCVLDRLDDLDALVAGIDAVLAEVLGQIPEPV